MKKLTSVLTILSVCTVQLSRAQVLTIGEPATATDTKYVLPSNPRSMLVRCDKTVRLILHWGWVSPFLDGSL